MVCGFLGNGTCSHRFFLGFVVGVVWTVVVVVVLVDLGGCGSRSESSSGSSSFRMEV